jgi:hypothetical protein
MAFVGAAMRFLQDLFRRRKKATLLRQRRDMISLVVLSNSHVALTLDTLRGHLEELYPGHFLPPRDKGTFVVEGNLPDMPFLIQSDIPGAAGSFLLHSVPEPYTAFSDFAEHIADASLRRLVQAQTRWLSVDLIHRNTTDAEAYRFIGSVLAELAPRDAAALVHPSRLLTIAFDDRVRRALANGGQIFGASA